MKACAGCFREDGPLVVTTDAGELGQCNFCGGHGVTVWEVTIWGEDFARVLEMYEPSELGSHPLHEQLQIDWQVFTFEGDTVFTFIQQALGGPGHELLDSRTPVRPRYELQGAAADHKTNWDEFRDALILENRYFPATDFDLDYMRDLILDNVRSLAEGLELFRARAAGYGVRYEPGDLGVPPRNLVRGGRGNPVGIAHLYLSNDLETCMRECRAEFNGFVSVATLRLETSITYLDLADLAVANPFRFEDSVAAVQGLVAAQLLGEFGRELSVPTKPGENQIEYVPTQYLCEFVKSLGIGGIRYRSSLRPDGWNLVLFEPKQASLVGAVRHFHVTNVELAYGEV